MLFIEHRPLKFLEDGMGKGSGRAGWTPIRIAFENGARDLIGNGPPE